MILSLQLADVGKRSAVRLMRTSLDPSKVAGLRYSEMTIAAPLSDRLLPRPHLGRVGLIAGWEDESAFEAFLASHPVAGELSLGWQVRLRPTRVFGSWQGLPDLPADEEPMEDTEPAAVLTLGRLRVSQTPRFLRASAAAENLAVRDPALLAATGLARPPGLVATFSLWRHTLAMRDYARGQRDPGHRAAVQAHAARPFHHESAFIRFRPCGAIGQWDGRNPLAEMDRAPIGVPGG